MEWLARITFLSPLLVDFMLYSDEQDCYRRSRINIAAIIIDFCYNQNILTNSVLYSFLLNDIYVGMMRLLFVRTNRLSDFISALYG